MAKNIESYGVLPATGYMRQSQLIPAIFPFSSATLWRKVKAGSFPAPVKLGLRITAWRVEDIRELLYRGVWAPHNRTGPSPSPKTRVGEPSLSTSEEVASRLTSNCKDPNVPSLTLDSGSEIEDPRPQTGSADCASSLLSSRKARAR
jgi:prophage regulatory protein